MFDPTQIDDSGTKTRDPVAVAARDADPQGFLDRMLAGEGLDDPLPPVIGIKVLFHHHPRLFREIIPQDAGLRLIHVRRDNKLAQFASARQVHLTGDWTAKPDGAPPPKIKAAPLWAAAQCNRLETEDFLMTRWIETLPNPSMRVDYAAMQQAETATRLLRFLGVASDVALRSGLRKQGQNRVQDRFANPRAIASHFRAIGRADWLGPELPE